MKILNLKRIIPFCVLICLIWAGTTSAEASDGNAWVEGAEWITDPALARGSDYTDHPVLAQRLDAVFAGAAGLYSDWACEEPYSAPIGSNAVPNWGEMLCVPDNQRGWSCYIYANGAYYALFGECPGDGDNEYRYSEALPGVTGTPETLYQALTEAGVRQTGAYCRNDSHSFLILSYDESGICLLDGNSINGGAGFIQITEATWEYFHRYFLAGGDNPIRHIVQPTETRLLGLFVESAEPAEVPETPETFRRVAKKAA